MKGKMAKAGYVQGDMKAHVEDMQRPESSFSQKDFGKTDEYIMRRNRQDMADARDIERKAYKGRYS